MLAWHFFIMLFACGAILLPLYNNYFGWNRIEQAENQGLKEWPTPRNFFGDHIADPPIPKGLSKAETDRWREELEKEKADRKRISASTSREVETEDLRNLSDSQIVSISLLGIKLSASDLDIFGSIALLLISMYYLLCVRRVTIETVAVFEEAASLELPARKYVYTGIRQSYVLNSAVDGIDGLHPLSGHSEQAAGTRPATRLSRWLFQYLTFVPVFTILAMLASDWYYLDRSDWQSFSAVPGGGGHIFNSVFSLSSS